MLGIGHKLDKLAKQKVLAERAREYNTKYDQLTGTGLHPEDAIHTLTQQDFQKRHQQKPQPQPYNISKNINPLGGTVNQGYFEAHKINSSTKTMYQPMKEQMAKSKTTRPDTEALQQAKKQFERMKVRIYKDHLQQDAEIDLGEKKASDYKRNFVEDDKLKKEVHRDKRYNQWENDLKSYAEAYLKCKQCLRKC